jgi:hypothetical protein
LSKGGGLVAGDCELVRAPSLSSVCGSGGCQTACPHAAQ